MKKIGLMLSLLSFSSVAFAEGEEINLVFDDQMIALNFRTQPELLERIPKHYLLINDKKIPLDFGGQLPKGDNEFFNIETTFETRVSPVALHDFFEEAFAIEEVRNSTVKIETDENNELIVFEGTPKDGVGVDEPRLHKLLARAMASGEKNVRVPSRKIFSNVVINSDLQEKGIKEVLAIGKSNFAGSSKSRRQNIWAAARKFNGVLIGKGREFSFNNILQNVSERDGFVKELVIRGNELRKEFGGGTCQVSTTAFRAAYFGGLPITSRREHSYAVPYYKPAGVDATIYLGAVDFRFRNDTPGNILIQTFIEGDNLFFAFYGTRDSRRVMTEGPFVSNIEAPRSPLVFETNTLPPGKVEYLSGAYDGFQTEWVRKVQKDGKWTKESLVSEYRPWRAQILKGREKVAGVSLGGRN